MEKINSVTKDRFSKIILACREQNTFKLKVNSLREAGVDSDQYWLAMYIGAPLNFFINTHDDKVVHQNWELKGISEGTTEDDEEVDIYYIFEYVGFEQHGTWDYNGTQLAVPFGAFNNLLKEEADANPVLVPKLNNTAGLEHIHLSRIPGVEGFALGLKMNQ